MASIGHVAVGLAAARVFRRSVGAQDQAQALSSVGTIAAFLVLSLAPDLDVLAFSFGIPYWAPFGHRGAMHSLAFAVVLGFLAAALMSTRKSASFSRAALFSILTVASHPLLDALTDGGLGVALLWPFSNARFFAPIRVIPVAPIGTRFMSGYGLFVAMVELIYFAPLFVFALWPRRTRLPRYGGSLDSQKPSHHSSRPSLKRRSSDSATREDTPRLEAQSESDALPSIDSCEGVD